MPLLDRQEFDALDPEAADSLVAPLRQPRQHAPAHPHDDGGQQQEDQRGGHGRGRSDDKRARAERRAGVLDDAPEGDQQLVGKLPPRFADQLRVVIRHGPNDFAAQDEVARRLAVFDGQVARPDRLVARDALEAPRHAFRAVRRP